MAFTASLDGAKASLAAIGIPFGPLFYYLCIVLTVPAMLPMRYVRGTARRHLYAAASGLAVCGITFGPTSAAVQHILLMVTYSYGLMHVARRYCGLTVFAAAFAHLLYCHAINASVPSRNQGDVDYTGLQMVLCLKVISVAFNYQDGLLGEEKLSKSQTARVVRKLPALHEYLGYIFMGGSLLAGPVYEFRDYDDFVHHRGVWNPKTKLPSTMLPTLVVVGQSLLAVTLTAVLAPRFPVESVLEPWFLESSLLYKTAYLLVYCEANCKLRFYAAWFMTEAAYRLCGFAFNGYTSDEKPRWDRTLNVYLFGTELCSSGALLPQVWNIGTSTWLRVYVYERILPARGKSVVFLKLLITQTVAGAWHGASPGFILFFTSSAAMLHAAKVLYKLQAALPPPLRRVAEAGHVVMNQINLAYLSQSFLLLNWPDVLTAWSSLFYLPHVFWIAVGLVGLFVQPRPWRLAAPKAVVVGELNGRAARGAEPPSGLKSD